MQFLKNSVVFVSLVLCASGMPRSGCAEEADGPGNETPLADSIFNSQPSFLVSASVNRATRDYREGDSLTISVASEEDAYLYVLYQQADGKIYQVFPNKFQPDNLVQARQTVRVPAETDLFRWTVSGPFGKELIKVIATKEPVDVLSQVELIKERFNPVSEQVMKGIEVELGEDQPIRWAETDVAIHTYADSRPPADAAKRRWGVFFGVSRHMFTPYVVAAKGPKASPDLFACHRDAQKFGEAMRTTGRLDGIKVYTNEQATKANMQLAITQWLPSVSRPGDTVFIYYSGHTGQVPDRSGDEADQQDELLIPHDFIGAPQFEALQMLYDDDKLEPEMRQAFEKLVQAYKNRPLLDLVENTGVSDDLLARWVQRLDGRQVVIISDSCHSGGLATNEPQFKQLAPDVDFDLFQQELVRLKDLGQDNHVLLCAAHANEVAAERPTKDMGVMTYCLVEYLNNSLGSQRLEEAFQYCEAEMPRYFDEWNKALEAAGSDVRITASHPFLLNSSGAQVLLKP